jgi:phosphohistidine phosphatase
MQLYFLRHGEAGKKAEWEGDDRERPLSGAGMERMKQVAAAIVSLSVRPDRIVSSPLVRARQTAEIMARTLKPPATLDIDDRLAPGFGPAKLAEIIGEHSDAEALMFVGHEPDFSQTIAACIGGGRVECRTGGLARVDIASKKAIHGTLLWLVPPLLLAP